MSGCRSYRRYDLSYLNKNDMFLCGNWYDHGPNSQISRAATRYKWHTCYVYAYSFTHPAVYSFTHPAVHVIGNLQQAVHFRHVCCYSYNGPCHTSSSIFFLSPPPVLHPHSHFTSTRLYIPSLPAPFITYSHCSFHHPLRTRLDRLKYTYPQTLLIGTGFSEFGFHIVSFGIHTGEVSRCVDLVGYREANEIDVWCVGYREANKIAGWICFLTFFFLTQ